MVSARHNPSRSALRSRRLPWGLAGIALLACPAAAIAKCDDIVPATANTAVAKRLVTPEDIVGLRDIGLPDASLVTAESPLAVSPDGRRVAFLINRAVPETNDYCRALVVMDLRAGAVPQIVDTGGALITLNYVLRGIVEHPGFPDLIVPVWSPDGRWIAYRKRVNDVTQAWRAAADGSGAHPVSALDDDVEALAWSADGARMIVAVRPGLRAQARRIKAEGLDGFLYDDRFSPNDGPRPKLVGPEPRVLLAVDIASGAVATASTADGDRLSPEMPLGIPPELAARSAGGRQARLAHETPSLFSPMRLRVDDSDGTMIACRAEACSGSITALIWTGETLNFLRREGWAKGEMALYRWVPGAGQPRRIMATKDVVLGCVRASVRFACLAENAVTPRHVVMLDPRTGRREQLFDPNPEFANIRLGEVRRLKFRNNLGLEAWGDLVLPPGYRQGRLPLVVVQYHSDGFLRGGTGDDYPIHAFAARGMAVLSFERPADVAAKDPEAKADEQVNAANARGWGERWSVLSAVETGVQQAIDLGIADPARIGITGLSDGAVTTAFALINSKMFAAAAISSCCMDPHSVMSYGGPVWARSLRRQGYPPATQSDPEFWKPMSIALNAARIDTPLLMQLADREYLLALEAWTALSEQNKPVEMYIFPDEYHSKWQPRHRLAVYNRNLDWFDFWLASKIDPDPAKIAQYERWQKLRALRRK